MDDFVIARNPEEGTTLPFLARLPLGRDGVVLKVRDTWPRTQKMYCHPAAGWPEEPDIVERVGVTRCVRRGASIDLVLDRGRENRSMFVFSRSRGREVIFWQSARTAKQARPDVSLPTARASGQVLAAVAAARTKAPTAPSDTRRVSAATIRAWARSVGLDVTDRGRIPGDVADAFRIVHAAEAHDPGHDSMARNTDR